jgi:hypothetical protein
MYLVVTVNDDATSSYEIHDWRRPMSTLAEKVNHNVELSAMPLDSTEARPLSTITTPVLCLGVAVAVAAVGIAAGAVYGEVAD